jgi:hypothetical protein
MPISDHESEQYIHDVQKVAQPATDTLIRFDSAGKLCGLGSCVYVSSSNGSKVIGVTCNHVLKENGEYFVGAKRLDEPMIPSTADHGVQEVKIIQRYPKDDFAFFDVSGIDLSAAKKTPIDLSRLIIVTPEVLKKIYSML